MINLRIYRASLLLVPLAIAAAMFSLESIPEGRVSTTAPDAFDGSRVAAAARQLAKQAPNPAPGSASDAEVARKVGQQFGQIEGSQVTEQRFKAQYEGEEVELVNVICVLPGETEDQVVLMAGRDAARGPGVGTAFASTASLLEIAASFGGSTHEKTLVFVSTDGTGLGAEGARRFSSGYSDIGRVQEIVILSQPAALRPRQPVLIPWSAGPQSASIEFVQTVSLAIENETEASPTDESAYSELSRLAIPSGLGEQAPLLEDGFDAVRISSSGELPPDPIDDGPKDISATSLGRFGRSALATMLVLDSSAEPFEHGPDAYIGLFDNLVPGWALALISLSLILPLLLTALAALVGQVRRGPEQPLRSLGWVGGRMLPFFAALLFAYVLALVGLIDRPEYPYDPDRFPPGTGGKVAMGLIAAVLLAGLIVVKPWRPPPAILAAAAGPVCITLIALGGLGVWFINPYLALLLAPALHAWLLLTPEETAVGSLLAAVITFVGLVPLIAAIAELADRFDVGWDVVWQLLLLIGDGQISIVLTALGCVLAGCAMSALALARSRIAPEPPEISIQGPEIRVEGP